MEHELYKEHILQHYRYPHNKRALAGANCVCREINALCGDDVTLYCVYGENGIVTELTFTGDGCAISQAAASLFTDFAVGKRVRDVSKCAQSDMETLLGIVVSPARARCALLPVQALRNGLKDKKEP